LFKVLPGLGLDEEISALVHMKLLSHPRELTEISEYCSSQGNFLKSLNLEICPLTVSKSVSGNREPALN
jgi:hypothetical protein